MTWPRLLGFTLALLACWFVALPLAAQPELIAQGRIFGAVKTKDGAPIPGIPVQCYGGDAGQRVVTDVLGRFAISVPPGEYTLSTFNTSATVHVGIEVPKEVTLTVDAGGVILLLENATEEDSLIVRGACKVFGRVERNLTGQQMDEHAYWFPAVPMTAKEFAVVVSFSGSRVAFFQRASWTFERMARLRVVRLALEKSADIRLPVTLPSGKPLSNLPVEVAVTCPLFWYDYWDAARQEQGEGKQTLLLETDGQGMLDLGRWPPRTYTVTVKLGDDAGDPVLITVAPDGKVTPAGKFVIDPRLREVRQTIFGADGAPAAQAPVQASYLWLDRIWLTQARANARGIVTWSELPPVPLTVWGEGIPPVIVPADAVEVTALLPRVEKGRTCWVIPELRQSFSETGRIAWWARVGEAAPVTWSQMRYPYEGENGEATWLQPFKYTAGEPCDLLVAFTDSRCVFQYLRQVYLPVPEKGGDIHLPLALEPALELRVEFKAVQDGRPPDVPELPALSRIRLAPKDTLTGLPPREALDAVGMLMARRPRSEEEEFERPRRPRWPKQSAILFISAPEVGDYTLVIAAAEDNKPPVLTRDFPLIHGLNGVTVTLPGGTNDE